jgi:hypothetical protein
MPTKYIKKQVDTAAIMYIEELKIYAVPSASDPSKVYEIKNNGHKYECSCMDYIARHADKETECKHGRAVREFELKRAATVGTP